MVLICGSTVACGLLVIRRLIHDVAVQLIYGAVPMRIRRGLIAKVLGLAKPAAEAVVAAGIALSTVSFGPRPLT